ncbi:MAG: Mini-ribonuclease 3 [Bacilli bacterium]|nr:Mini-ribonuclease 3 [Bacilli bacterium]
MIVDNSLVLAYLGDAIYEVYIRKYLISKGICKVNDLQKEAVKYVSAKSQSDFLEKMINDEFLTSDELIIVKRARNHKSHGSKSTDIVTYKRSTGLEALIGYLELKGDEGRILEIMKYIVGD